MLERGGGGVRGDASGERDCLGWWERGCSGCWGRDTGLARAVEDGVGGVSKETEGMD